MEEHAILSERLEEQLKAIEWAKAEQERLLKEKGERLSKELMEKMSKIRVQVNDRLTVQGLDCPD